MVLRILYLLTACCLTIAQADQWMSPQPIELASENKEWAVQIQPKGTTHALGNTEAKGAVTATITHAGETVQFELRNEWMPVDAALLDSGQLLTFDDWHQMGYGPSVAVLYSPTGETIWHHSLGELITQQKEQQAPHSASSIWWRKTPLEWHDGANQESIRITLADEHQLEIKLVDGTTEFIEVQEIGDDAERLAARARAESRAGNYAKESALLERVIALSPEDLNAHVTLGDAYNRQQLYEKTQTLLTAASEHFGSDHPDAYGIVNLYCTLAKAYAPNVATSGFQMTMIGDNLVRIPNPEYSNNIKAATTSLRIACQIEPSYTRPYQQLAELFKLQGLETEIDALMQARADLPPKHPYQRQRILTDIGKYYQSRHQYEVAAQWYEHVYSPTTVSNTFTYTSLANTYEKLSKYDQAIAIHQQLIAYWEAMNTDNIWNRDIQRATDSITKLSLLKNEQSKTPNE